MRINTIEQRAIELGMAKPDNYQVSLVTIEKHDQLIANGSMIQREINKTGVFAVIEKIKESMAYLK